MHTIHHKSPFGFTFEIHGTTPYYANSPYQIYLDGQLDRTSSCNMVSMYGLQPATAYHVRLTGESMDEQFSVTTDPAPFIINVTDYGAAGDGNHHDTSSIQTAIYAAPTGATVLFPKGIYLVSHILLKSNVDIYLEQGCTLIQTTNRSDLAVLHAYQTNYDHSDAVIQASWEGNPLDSYCSLIYGKDVENISIYGDGTLDGNGEQSGFWLQPKMKNIAFRPKNIFLNACRNITMAGITSQNSASWNIHPFYCDDLKFLCLKLLSPADSPNTDGLNPESCQNVDILGCHFYVGDDCIAIKSGKFFMSEFQCRSSKNITIRNCLMERGHGGVVIGSEISCGVCNVLVDQCYFKATDRGLRIKTRRGRGHRSVVDHILFQNTLMEDVKHCFVINMFYFCDPDGQSDYVQNKKPIPKDNGTPTVQNITCDHITCTGITGSSMFLYGLPENKINHVHIIHSSFAYANHRTDDCPAMLSGFTMFHPMGILIENADDVTFDDNCFTGAYKNKINGIWEESN